MRFGIHLIQQNITLAECRDLWRWADTAGFDWFDVSDHFYESPMTEKRGPYLECLTCLAALACDTQHMRIGTVVLAMDYRHPAVLANALAASDAHRAAADAHFAEVFGASGDAFRTRGAITERQPKRSSSSRRTPKPASTASTSPSALRSTATPSRPGRPK